MDGRGNILLASFDDAPRAFLEKRLQTKFLVSGDVLQRANAPLEKLIFPHDGMVSLQSIFKDGHSVEKAAVGMDGCVGIEAVLGETCCSYQAVAMLPGAASCLSVHDLVDTMEHFPGVRSVLMAHTARKFRQVMQSVACASLHSASQRIATWLLHADDVTSTSRFELTQRMLANLFGLRVATVSEAFSRLQRSGAIDHSRGVIRIIDRTMLTRQACECYNYND